MNLFRSEEHALRWPLLNPGAEEGVTPLPEIAALFSTESRHHVADRDYVSRWLPQRESERQEALVRQGWTSPYWRGQT